MTPQTAGLMASYNQWMNQRMFQAAAGLAEEEVTRDRGAFFGSILQTLNHIAVADTIWLHRFAQHPEAVWLQGALGEFPQPASLRQELSASLSGLQSYRVALDALILRWSGSLTLSQLEHALTYRNMAGQSHTKPFGFLVQHFFNHQTHHRGQVSTLLFQAGVDVGVTDLLAVIPNET